MGVIQKDGKPPRLARGRRPPPRHPNQSETKTPLLLDWNEFIARWICYSEARTPLQWLDGDVWVPWNKLPQELRAIYDGESTSRHHFFLQEVLI
jgi:hypothetical protein